MSEKSFFLSHFMFLVYLPPENIREPDFFRVCRKRSLALNRLMEIFTLVVLGYEYNIFIEAMHSLVALLLWLYQYVLAVPVDDPSKWPGHLEPFGSKQKTVPVDQIYYWPSAAGLPYQLLLI